MTITPLNGMPKPSKREPYKRTGGLLIGRIHWRHTPTRSVRPELVGTQSRGESTRKQRYGESGDRPVVHCLRGGSTQTNLARAPAAASSGSSYIPALGPWKERYGQTRPARGTVCLLSPRGSWNDQRKAALATSADLSRQPASVCRLESWSGCAPKAPGSHCGRTDHV